MYTWSCNECETPLWSRDRVPGGGSCPACGAWLSQTATEPLPSRLARGTRGAAAATSGYRETPQRGFPGAAADFTLRTA